MGLSDSVEALLETYSKCIDLLRVFSSSDKGSLTRSPGSPGRSRAAVAYGSLSSSDWDRQSQLSHSLRTDRAKIQKAYSDRLSETGSRLQKGDGQSRSALRRIIRRLTDALANILGFGSSSGHRGDAMPDGRPLLNYDALRALSNASRIDAIHAIDEVSMRLSSRNSASVRSHSSRAYSGRDHSVSASASSLQNRPKQSQNSKRHRRTPGSSSGSSRGSSSSDRRGSSKTAVDSQISQLRSKKAKAEASSSSRESNEQARPGKKHKQSISSHHRSGSSVSINNNSGGSSIAIARSRSSRASGHLGRRVSMMSSSTASTKLGEIPERKLRRRQPPATNTGDPWSGVAPGYNIRPAYPMRPMRMPDVGVEEEQKPKKRFWGMFS
ncbi:hypothetical protein SEUCBS140593_001500 [Sporothrix eucalyptigena]|uniref:Uncharacterized protein n=1 Tax=Sporothrix eucalyptigena TaxID=1812306 RepID=A0ABP0AYQ0_9PEZI